MSGDNWVEKHRPETFDDVQGNTKALNQIERWAKNWEVGDPAILLHGPPGTGKTTTAYIVADVIDASFNQINASSARKTEDLEAIADDVSMTPIDEDLQVVLLDEVDSWSGNVSPRPIVDVLDEPRNPIIMTANEKYEIPDSIRYHSNVDDYKFKLNVRSRKAKLKEIAEREDVDLSDEHLERLGERPDLRSAINDLQLLASGGTVQDDGRTWEVNEFAAVKDLMMGDPEGVRQHSPDDMIQWVDHNLTDNYRGLEASLAYKLLAEADISLGRIWAQGDPNFRYMKWAGELIAETANMRMREQPERHWLNVDFPNWFRTKKVENQYSDEHALFDELKDREDGSYRFSGDFVYFLHVVLPILKEQPFEKRCRIALNNGLYEITDDGRTNDDPLKALDLTKTQYEDWVEEEEPETGEWEPPSKDAMDW